MVHCRTGVRVYRCSPPLIIKHFQMVIIVNQPRQTGYCAVGAPSKRLWGSVLSIRKFPQIEYKTHCRHVCRGPYKTRIGAGNLFGAGDDRWNCIAYKTPTKTKDSYQEGQLSNNDTISCALQVQRLRASCLASATLNKHSRKQRPSWKVWKPTE